MTPHEYYLEYRNLTVDLVNGQQVYGIDVHEYRNARDVFDTNDIDDISADHDAGPGWDKAWARLRSKISKHGKKLGTHRYSLLLPLAPNGGPAASAQTQEIVITTELASAFIGKGSPSTIARVLRLAAAFELVAPTSAAMNEYCSKYIGLDCNGFVGNYLAAEGATGIGPSTSANASSFVPEPRRVSKLEDVDYRSVLAWKNTQHVAIIDHMQPLQYQARSILAMVCESTGAQLVPGDVHTDGLNYTMYEIHEPNKHNVFKVKRGIGGAALNEVYIGNFLARS